MSQHLTRERIIHTLKPAMLLHLRSGWQWTGRMPLVNVLEARSFKANEDADAHRITVGNEPNITLHFAEPVHLYGPYWVQADARKIALQVDDAQGFLTALNAK